MKPLLVRLFVKRQNGTPHVGFVRQQRFYPVEGVQVSEGLEVLVKEVTQGSPSYSGEYSVLVDGKAVSCRTSFPI